MTSPLKAHPFGTMHDGMMWFMVLGALIVLAVVVLIVAALIKYLFFR